MADIPIDLIGPVLYFLVILTGRNDEAADNTYGQIAVGIGLVSSILLGASYFIISIWLPVLAVLGFLVGFVLFVVGGIADQGTVQASEA